MLKTLIGTTAAALALSTLPALAEIKIGSIVELSGPGAAAGTNFRDGVHMGFEEVNAAGGILSEPVSRPWERSRSHALWRSLHKTGHARSGARSSGGSTWLWPMDFLADTKSGISSPRIKCQKRSPTTPPQTLRSFSFDAAHSLSTV